MRLQHKKSGINQFHFKGSEGGPNISERIFINESEYQTEGGNKWKSILTLNDISYLDTGRYECSYKREPSEDQSNDDDTVSIYLFANNGKNLIDQGLKVQLINVPEQGSTVIPCRPTSEDVKMSFKQVIIVVNQIASRNI